jgi:hypothetical protein
VRSQHNPTPILNYTNSLRILSIQTLINRQWEYTSMPTPEHTPIPNPGARRIRLEKVGTYTVGELGEGRYIVLDDTFSNCYLVEASSPTEAVEVVDGVLGREVEEFLNEQYLMRHQHRVQPGQHSSSTAQP